MNFVKIAISVVLIYIVIGCTNKPTETSKVDSNSEMAALLDSLHKNAVPEETYNLNDRRAESWKAKLDAAATPEEKVVSQFQYASELLYSGKSMEAINELEAMLNAFGGAESVLEKPNAKTLVDQLAVAYLRYGEQQNCVENHTSASCIVPLAEEGWHKLPTGSENAIKWYAKILEKYPDDYQSRWLMNIGHMTLGQYPAGVPSQWRMPEKTFYPQNTAFKKFNEVAIPLGLDIMGMSGGSCIEDFDNDGFLDVFATAYGLTNQARLFRNRGDGTFEEITEKAGLKGITGGLNIIHADYNNDGFSDVLILRGGWLGKGGNYPNSLLRNNGNGTFTDVTKEAGLLSFHPTQTASWGDFNNDGYLDLFIGNESSSKVTHPCELYKNNGDGTFTEMAAAARLNFATFVKGVTWGDINNDGLQDLFISVLGGKNMLFVNRGGNAQAWVFEEIGDKAEVSETLFTFPCWFWDYNNDGFQDILVAGYDLRRLSEVGADAAREYLGMETLAETIHLFKNNGNETFTDITVEAGLNKVAYAMGANFGDLDNDGFPDFYLGTGAPDYRSLVPNRMFRNRDGKSFEEVTMFGFGNIQKGHGVSFGDLDNDGDQEIYCVMGGAYQGDVAQNVLFENPGFGNSWLTLRLKGSQSNKAAIGARIKVNVLTAGGKKRSIWQTVTTGGTFGSSSLQQEIGLGDASAIESVEVYWPSGRFEPETFTGIPLNSLVEITEGNKQAEKKNISKITLKTTGHSGHQHH